jgi:hypothetical protein
MPGFLPAQQGISGGFDGGFEGLGAKMTLKVRQQRHFAAVSL